VVEPDWINEPERNFCDANLRLECRVYGHAPVQADGRLAGQPLYFRARHCGWSFTLCTNVDIDPSAIAPPTQQGFFRSDDCCGYELWGDYGSENEASFMPYAVAEQLIRECAMRYLEEIRRSDFRPMPESLS